MLLQNVIATAWSCVAQLLPQLLSKRSKAASAPEPFQTVCRHPCGCTETESNFCHDPGVDSN
jgi:hypothetical protein